MQPWTEEKTTTVRPGMTDLPEPLNWVSPIDTLARMYGLADKYILPELKTDIASRFLHRFSTSTFNQILGVLPIVYESTPNSDRGLRDLCVKNGKALWISLSHSPSYSKWKETYGGPNGKWMEDLLTSLVKPLPGPGRCEGCQRTDKWSVFEGICTCGRVESATLVADWVHTQILGVPLQRVAVRIFLHRQARS